MKGPFPGVNMLPLRAREGGQAEPFLLPLTAVWLGPDCGGVGFTSTAPSVPEQLPEESRLPGRTDGSFCG